MEEEEVSFSESMKKEMHINRIVLGGFYVAVLILSFLGTTAAMHRRVVWALVSSFCLILVWAFWMMFRRYRLKQNKLRLDIVEFYIAWDELTANLKDVPADSLRWNNAMRQFERTCDLGGVVWRHLWEEHREEIVRGRPRITSP